MKKKNRKKKFCFMFALKIYCHKNNTEQSGIDKRGKLKEQKRM